MQPIENKSKIYKFKIHDIKFNVIIDDYYTINYPINEIDIDLKCDNLHYHAVHELFFVKDSCLTIVANDSSYEYNDCIVCIPPFFKHRTYGENIHKIFFSVEGLEKSSGDFYVFLREILNSETPIKLSKSPTVDLYINETEKLLNNKNSINNEIISTLFKLIFYYIHLNNFTNDQIEPYNGNESYLIKIDAIINRYQNDIDLTSVANELCLSTKQTSRIVKKHYKKSLSDLVTEKRLEVACGLLRHSEKSISQIVEEINFSSETYFYYQFKKNFGCTPSEYKYKKNAD